MTVRVGLLLSLLVATILIPVSTLQAAPPVWCFAVGDSLAAGIGSTLPRTRSAAALLCEWVGTYTGERTELINLAVPGEQVTTFSSNGQMERLRQQLQQARREGRTVAFVLMSLGGNDLLKLLETDDSERDALFEAFQSEFRSVLTEARNQIGSTPLLILSLYDLSEGDPTAPRSDSWWVARVNEVIRQAGAGVEARVLPLDEVFRGQITQWTWWPVDVHPTNSGYEAIARLAWKALAIDLEPPAVSLERPRVGEKVTRRYMTVRARVWDPGGVEQVQLWVDGKPIGTLDPLPDGQEWIGLWETRWPEPGPATVLEVRAVDRAGQVGRASVRLERSGG